MISPSFVVLLVCMVCLVSSYQLTSSRMQVTMSSNPFSNFLGGLNKQSASSSGAGGVKTVLITGATGLIGTELTKSLRSKNISVRRLTTGTKKDSDDYSWNPSSDSIDVEAFEGVDAVIHLAGENIASGSLEGPLNLLGRWSDAKKSRILESRVQGTKLIVDTLLQLKKKPKVFISSSATGYYGFSDTKTEFTESDGNGDGFLSEVCSGWETEALKFSKAGRTVCVRNGVVLSKKGGLLAKLAPLFNLGGGGNIGSGEQGLSWISVDDAVSGIEFALNSGKVSGPVNLCAPVPASNAEFTQALGSALGRPTLFPLPAIVAKAIFGEFGEEVLLGGQFVTPSKLTKAGFVFADTDLKDTITRILK